MNTYLSAVEYLESLPDKLGPSITLSFRRTEDFRRKVMQRNCSPIVHHDCHISIRKDCASNDVTEYSDGCIFWHFTSSDADVDIAIDGALKKLKDFLDQPSRSVAS